MRGATLEHIKRCLSAGSDAEHSDADGWTPLHFAAAFDAPADFVRVLIEAGANPNAATSTGVTPLGIAAYSNAEQVVVALVEAGADPNAADEDGWTALHWAARYGSAAVVRAIAHTGADPHRRSRHGRSALALATFFGAIPSASGAMLRLHLPEASMTSDGRWQRSGLHDADCWFGQERAWPIEECFYFVVTEDKDDDASRLIGIPVVRFPASRANRRSNPILHLGAGGPGGAMDFATIWPVYRALVEGADRDLYVVDPRGAGMSYPRLHCRERLDITREGLANALDARADEMLRSEAYRVCKARLDAERRNLAHYNSVAVATDLEFLRRALGVRQWVLWGSSYGARYALTIARDFPAAVEAMVLTAAVFPGWPRAETRAGKAERAIERTIEYCSRDGLCQGRSLSRRFWRLVADFDTDPLVLTDLDVMATYEVERLELTGTRLLRGVLAGLYDPGLHEAFPFLVQQLERRRTSMLEQFVLAPWLGSLLDATHSSSVSAAHYCAEEKPFVDYEAAGRDALKANAPIRAIAEARLEQEQERCQQWGLAPARPTEGEVVTTAIPTLFVQGALDPITPIDHLRSQLGYFANHELLVFDHGSHWGSVHGRCAMEAGGYFVRHKRIEERHRQCTAAREPQ